MDSYFGHSLLTAHLFRVKLNKFSIFMKIRLKCDSKLYLEITQSHGLIGLLWISEIFNSVLKVVIKCRNHFSMHGCNFLAINYRSS